MERRTRGDLLPRVGGAGLEVLIRELVLGSTDPLSVGLLRNFSVCVYILGYVLCIIIYSIVKCLVIFYSNSIGAGIFNTISFFMELYLLFIVSRFYNIINKTDMSTLVELREGWEPRIISFVLV